MVEHVTQFANHSSYPFELLPHGLKLEHDSFKLAEHCLDKWIISLLDLPDLDCVFSYQVEFIRLELSECLVLVGDECQVFVLELVDEVVVQVLQLLLG